MCVTSTGLKRLSVQSAALIHRFDYDIKTMQYDATTRKCDAPGRGALVRCFTCCTLDETKQFLLCGSTAGDVSVFNVDVGQFRASFPVCSAGSSFARAPYIQ